jgi:hypothetical protein
LGAPYRRDLHDALVSTLVDDVIAEARTLYDASAENPRHDELRRELADLGRAQGRLTDAVANGADSGDAFQS